MTDLNPYAEIPKFEGREVNGAMVQITGKAPLEDLSDVVLEIDDRVQLATVFTVIGVDHKVDSSGNLIRVHTLKAAEATLQPFGDDDDGVLRHMPRAIGQRVDEGGDDA